MLSVTPAGRWGTSAERLRARVCEQGVPEELVFLDVLKRVAVELAAGRGVKGVLIAKGRPVEHGTDAELFLDFMDLTMDPSTVDGVVDHRDRGKPMFVEAGAVLGNIRYETQGRTGLSTTGNELPPIVGRALNVTMGEGIEVAENGVIHTRYPGFLVFSDQVLEVRRDYRIQGDVDYTTGHITLEQGDVFVEGGVLPGFRIETPGRVEIKGDVEGASITAGGDVIIHGIVVEGAGCTVRSGGIVRASRIAGACKIIALGDVEVKTEVYGSSVQTASGLRVPGRVIGGTVLAVGGVEVGVLGGAAYTETRVAVGRCAETLTEVSARVAELQAGVARLERLVGNQPGREMLRQRLDALKVREHFQRTLMERLQAPAGSSVVRVRKALFPGVQVVVDDQPVQAREPVRSCTVRRADTGGAVIVSGRAAA